MFSFHSLPGLNWVTWLISTGCDAMTGLGVEARTTSVNTDYLLNSGQCFRTFGQFWNISLLKEFLFLKGVQPALLTTISGNNLWQNPSPGSSAYMRCLGKPMLKNTIWDGGSTASIKGFSVLSSYKNVEDILNYQIESHGSMICSAR